MRLPESDRIQRKSDIVRDRLNVRSINHKQCVKGESLPCGDTRTLDHCMMLEPEVAVAPRICFDPPRIRHVKRVSIAADDLEDGDSAEA
jgi:hypothetical protein